MFAAGREGEEVRERMRIWTRLLYSFLAELGEEDNRRGGAESLSLEEENKGN